MTTVPGLGMAVYARMRAHPGRRAELVDALRPLIDSGAREQETTAYLLHESTDDPDAVWFYARFADQQALETHRANEAALAAELAGLGDHLAEVVVEYGTVCADKHVPPTGGAL